MRFFPETTRVNHSISEPILCPHDEGFRNSIQVSNAIGAIPKWSKYFAPILRYEQARAGVPNAEIVGVLDSVDEREMAIAYVPKFEDWLLSDVICRYGERGIYNPHVVANDFRVQTGAALGLLHRKDITFFAPGMESLKMSPEARPILSDFSRSYLNETIQQLAPFDKRNYLRALIEGIAGSYRKYLIFPLYLFSKLETSDFPVRAERLIGERELYIDNHPLSTIPSVRKELRFDYTSFTEVDLAVHCLNQSKEIDSFYFHTFSEYIRLGLPDKID